MENVIRVIIIVLIVLIILAIIPIIIVKSLKKQNLRKMYSDIEEVLNRIIKKNDEIACRLTVSEVEAYDYLFETPKFCYYIKAIYNPNNQEICVNNSIKWQLRKDYNDESMRYVSGIEGLIRLDLPETNGRFNKKIFIIYPEARTMLKYINECEMIFVKPDTDIYGANIITFTELKEHPENLKLLADKTEENNDDILINLFNQF